MYGNVLFVNKDSKNFRKRSPQEARAINEHINGTYARFSKSQREQKSTSSRHAPVEPPSTRHSNNTNEKQRPTTDGSDEDEDMNDSPTSRIRHSSESSRAHSRHATPLLSSPAMERQQSLQAASGSLNTDDINAIKFATEFHIHAVGLAEIPGVPSNQLWYKWWFSSRQDIRRQETQLALLAWAYSSMTFVHSSSGRDRVVKALEFRGAALQQLQHLMQSLKSQSDYATALDCTLYLGCVEWQHGLINETIAHLKAAKSFLDMMGGIKILPPQSQETILWIFNNVSFTFPIRPLIQPGDFAQSSSRHSRHSPDSEGINSLSRMSLDDDRSSGGIVNRLIGSRLASALAETVELIVNNEALADLTIAPSEKVKRFHDLYMRKLALQVDCGHLWHDMLDAAPTSTRGHGSPQRSAAPASSFRLTFCLLLRLFQKLSTDTFTLMLPWKRYWTPWHDKALDRLRPIQFDIQTRTGCYERPDREQKAKELILLWMVFTGACIEQMFLIAGARDVGHTDRVIFCSSQFTNLARQMGYRRAADVAADFQKYIAFSSTKQGQILRKLMQPLEHGRQYSK